MTELEIDAGNTFIKWRICRDGVAEPQQRWLTDEIKRRSIQIPVQWLSVDRVRYVNVAGEEINHWINQLFQKHAIPCDQALVQAQSHGLKNAYHHPSQMGADRWVAMLAAWQALQTSFCVIDAGSAITIDWVDRSGQHLGGYILPGLMMLKKSLLGQTAQVRWQENTQTGLIEPGKTTAECVEHGCRYQLAALMKALASECKARQLENLWVTGGDALDLLAWLDEAEYHPLLVLEGLKYTGAARAGIPDQKADSEKEF